MLVVSGSHHPLFGQSSLLMFGAVLLVDARGKKKGVRMGVPAVMLRRGKNMLWWWVVTVAAGG